MHELSIAERLVAIAAEAVRSDAAARLTPSTAVAEVHVRLGALSGIEKDPLQFCYEIAVRDTPLEGSRLVVEDVPVVIYCPGCDRETELPDPLGFLCPTCGRPSGDVRRGRELELSSIHLKDQLAGTEGAG